MVSPSSSVATELPPVHAVPAAEFSGMDRLYDVNAKAGGSLASSSEMTMEAVTTFTPSVTLAV